MLGFFYIISSYIYSGIKYIKNTMHEKAETKYWKSKDKNDKNNYADIYITSKGEVRDIKTDLPSDVTQAKNGHDILLVKDKHGDIVSVRDITEKRKQYDIEDKINKASLNQTVIEGDCEKEIIKYRNINYLDILNNKIFFVKGKRYIDLETRKEFVIRGIRVNNNFIDNDRMFGWTKPSDGITLFYMDVISGLLIRRTDGQIFKDKNCIDNNAINIEETNIFINDYNKYRIEKLNSLNKNNIDEINHYFLGQQNVLYKNNKSFFDDTKYHMFVPCHKDDFDNPLFYIENLGNDWDINRL